MRRLRHRANGLDQSAALVGEEMMARMPRKVALCNDAHEAAAIVDDRHAAHLVRAVPHVVCVRVCAPFETRVVRMMQRLDTDDRGLVESEIRLSEEAHGAIIRRHFGIDWQQPEHYDLVLNTERVPIVQCVDKIAQLVEQPHFQETAESLRIFGDLALQTYVRTALRADPRTSKMNVLIQAVDGRVTLSGILDADIEERDAIDVVQSVKGVSEIECKLRSSAPPKYKLDS